MTKAEELAELHEEQRDYHMMLARGYRDDLARLKAHDPEEYKQWDAAATIGEQVFLARWHNRAAWTIRRHERMTPRQASLFGGAV